MLLPGASLAETYLDPDALVRAAQASGADALHPGYGFLSENPALARGLCAGRHRVGRPPARGDAGHGPQGAGQGGRRRGGRAGAAERAARCRTTTPAAGRAGGRRRLPAARQGVGRRGRAGHAPRAHRDELADAVASAQREAAGAFGSDEVFLERYLEPRATSRCRSSGTPTAPCSTSSTGSARCSAGTRRWSRRRRPSSCPTSTRREMWEAAVAAARAVGYVGVGTVEYLVDASGFYFLEMNTRLQVEHGVTELVTGLDLVGLQLLVAGGSPLPFAQDDVTARGHAVEVRLCAERPREGYRPTPGTVCARPLARGCRPARRPRHRVGQRGQPGLRLAGGQAHGARSGPGRRRGPPVACAARARARRARDQPRPARRPCSTTARSAAGGGHPLSRRPARPARRSSARRGAAAPRRRRRRSASRRARRPEPGPGAGGRLAQRRPAAARRRAHRRRRDPRGARPVVRRAGAGPGRRRLARPWATAGTSGATVRRPWRPGWSISPQKTGCDAATGSGSPRTAPTSTAPRASRASRCAPRTTPTSGAAWPASAARRCRA